MTVHNDLDRTFARARDEKRGALFPYLTAGYPDPDQFVDLAVSVLAAGADALEIGIPFSDPLLDGPSIQHSTQEALDMGITPPRCIEYAAEIHARSAKPLLFMSPYNPVLAYDIDRFCRDAGAAGIAGLIITDVPVEEQDDLLAATRAHSLHLIQLLAPTSTPERLRQACAVASGFIYCISVSGVTGARSGVAGTARSLVRAVRNCTSVPAVVGFGISGPEQAREVASFADGAAVGSALINLLATSPAARRIPDAEAFIRSLSDAMQREAVS
jgi:tryptophan synthase alpha chain